MYLNLRGLMMPISTQHQPFIVLNRDRVRSIIEGAHIHIFGFTNRENSQIQKKLMRQNPNI